jgi:hypothetical protein
VSPVAATGAPPPADRIGRVSVITRLRKKTPGVSDRPAARSGPTAPRTAILVVNGFSRREPWAEFNKEEAESFPWIELCVRQIERHSQGESYKILVWDNSALPDHRRFLRDHPKVRLVTPNAPDSALGQKRFRHGRCLDRLLTKVHPDTEFVITLDSDSFPIRDGWIQNLTGRLDDEVMLAGVWRDEFLPNKPAYIHPCGLAARAETLRGFGTSFAKNEGADVGHNVTEAALAAGGRVSKLHRSNQWNPHYLMGAVYGDLIYHQGAGSRSPTFNSGGPRQKHERLRAALRDAAFKDVDGLVEALAGNLGPDVVPEVVAQAHTGRED